MKTVTCRSVLSERSAMVSLCTDVVVVPAVEIAKGSSCAFTERNVYVPTIDGAG